MDRINKELYLLKNKMYKMQYIDLLYKINNSKETEETKYKTYIYPKVRQFGQKVVMKELDKYFDLSGNLFKANSELGKIIEKELEQGLDFDLKYEKMKELGLKSGALKKVKYYSFWINNNIYYLSSVMYGTNETNRQMCNEWKTSKMNIDNTEINIFFTMRDKEECKNFCDKWKDEEFKNSNKNQEKFRDEFIDFLVLKSK